MLRFYSSHLQDSRTSSTQAIGANPVFMLLGVPVLNHHLQRSLSAGFGRARQWATWRYMAPQQLKRIGGAVDPGSNRGGTRSCLSRCPDLHDGTQGGHNESAICLSAIAFEHHKRARTIRGDGARYCAPHTRGKSRLNYDKADLSWTSMVRGLDQPARPLRASGSSDS